MKKQMFYYRQPWINKLFCGTCGKFIGWKRKHTWRSATKLKTVEWNFCSNDCCDWFDRAVVNRYLRAMRLKEEGITLLT